MTWNWQQPDWPDFRWAPTRLRKAEDAFLHGAGGLAGGIRHLDDEDRDRLVVEAVSSEALTTSAIEGEMLDRASVQSSVQRALGLAAERRRSRLAEQGVSTMMVDLFRSFAEPLSDPLLFRWHSALLGGRDALEDVGRYRTGDDPMQVVSGPSYRPVVHFEAPPAAQVAAEMNKYVDWFNRSAPGGPTPLPALTRAGIAHLYFESIHPFEDGNGRIGRAISEKALAQTADRPALTALSATILRRRKAYYDALESANKGNEITNWLVWFSGIALEAQRRATAQVEFLIDKTKLLDRLRDQLNERQHKALVRVLREGPDGFVGGLSAGNYAAIAGASAATATRDLADMVAKGALSRAGERRYARYHPVIPSRPVGRVEIDGNGEVCEAAP